MARSKYGSRKVTIDGIVFDSIREAARYQELKLLEAAGEISDLQLQPRYELLPKFKREGTTYRAITYTADFTYCENGRVVVEDTKGYRTQQFELRRKLFLYHYPNIELRITA